MKRYILIVLLFVVNVSLAQGDVKLSGLILFKDSGNKKPDIGAKVYLRQVDKVTDWSKVGFFVRANSSRRMYEKLKKDDELQWLKKNNLSTKEEFDLFDNQTNEYVDSFIDDKSVYECVVGVNGEVNFTVKPGIYEYLIVSNNTSGSTLTEITGKVFGSFIDTTKENRIDWTFYSEL